MVGITTLDGLLSESAKRYPERIAVEEPGGRSLSYQQLDAASNVARDQLRAHGVRAGDRVGLYLEKSIASVISIFGILKSGAAYVPVDPHGPPSRIRRVRRG